MKKMNDTKLKCTQRMLEGLFSPGGNESSLTFSQTFMNRGCWMWSMHKLLVVAGAHVHGMVKRCNWFPFTHGQISKPKDNRILIEQNGIRKLEKKVVSIDKRSQAKVIATAYTNGNGGVILKRKG